MLFTTSSSIPVNQHLQDMPRRKDSRSSTRHAPEFWSDQAEWSNLGISACAPQGSRADLDNRGRRSQRPGLPTDRQLCACAELSLKAAEGSGAVGGGLTLTSLGEATRRSYHKHMEINPVDCLYPELL